MKIFDILNILWTLICLAGLTVFFVVEFEPLKDNSIKTLRYESTIETETGYALVYHESDFMVDQTARSVTQIVRGPLLNQKRLIRTAQDKRLFGGVGQPIEEKVLDEANALLVSKFKNIKLLQNCEVFSPESWTCKDSILGTSKGTKEPVISMQDNKWSFYGQSKNLSQLSSDKEYLEDGDHERWRTLWLLKRAKDGEISFLISKDEKKAKREQAKTHLQKMFSEN